MELINSTRMVAGYTMGLEPSGRELLVVVVKGTFEIPKNGEPVRLANEQLPLVMADTFTGEPGSSAPVYEVDFAPRKHRCDVLLNGSAYAPGGRPATRVEVGLSVNGMSKRFAVIGDRHWQSGLRGVTASAPEPFTVMPISYDRAFGGVDNRHEDPSKHEAFMRNPVGTGFHTDLRSEWVDGAPMPNTEEAGRPVSLPNSQSPVPMSFGSIGRGWEPRSKYAGTYDDAWRRDQFPLLPIDFNDQYYQAAPLDQQVRLAEGGEIRLINLTPEGQISFALPVFDAPIHFFPKKGPREDGSLILDTILLEPDEQRFALTWRATRPIKRNVFELSQVMVGQKTRAWWSEREVLASPMTVIMVASRQNYDAPSRAD
jgi:hypothetical protein